MLHRAHSAHSAPRVLSGLSQLMVLRRTHAVRICVCLFLPFPPLRKFWLLHVQPALTPTIHGFSRLLVEQRLSNSLATKRLRMWSFESYLTVGMWNRNRICGAGLDRMITGLN